MTRFNVLLICAGAVMVFALIGCGVVWLAVAIASAIRREREKIYFSKR